LRVDVHDAQDLAVLVVMEVLILLIVGSPQQWREYLRAKVLENESLGYVL
jgi:hypothetical protein